MSTNFLITLTYRARTIRPGFEAIDYGPSLESSFPQAMGKYPQLRSGDRIDRKEGV